MEAVRTKLMDRLVLLLGVGLLVVCTLGLSSFRTKVCSTLWAEAACVTSHSGTTWESVARSGLPSY